MEDRKITIEDLMKIFLTKVKTICNNISETYSIPSEYRNGNTFVLYGAVNEMKAQVVVNDRRLNAIPSSQVEQEVSKFLENRGISTRVGTVATTKSMINFFNNVSAFFSTKVVRITYPDGKSFLVYDPDQYSYPKEVQVQAKGKEASIEEQLKDNVTTTEYRLSVQDELNFINDIVNSRAVEANSQQMFVCSCSSSSCSCSSSSCSSSSSSYIVYMMV